MASPRGESDPLKQIFYKKDIGVITVENIFADISTTKPIYLVRTGKNLIHIPADRSSVDAEHGIVTFSDKNSVQAMFRLEDVKAFWRIN